MIAWKFLPLLVALDDGRCCNSTLGPPLSDVENITQKTGSAKTFPVFVKMLTTALGHGSESVFVDLLTYADLVSFPPPVLSTSENHWGYDTAQKYFLREY